MNEIKLTNKFPINFTIEDIEDRMKFIYNVILFFLIRNLVQTQRISHINLEGK